MPDTRNTGAAVLDNFYERLAAVKGRDWKMVDQRRIRCGENGAVCPLQAVAGEFSAVRDAAAQLGMTLTQAWEVAYAADGRAWGNETPVEFGRRQEIRQRMIEILGLRG